jgi:hypothetical protein
MLFTLPTAWPFLPLRSATRYQSTTARLLPYKVRSPKGCANYLHLTNPFFESVVVPNIPAAADVTAAFAAETTAEQFTAAAPNTPSATNVTTRCYIWVPPPYVDELFALLDNGNGYIDPLMLWTTAERALADPVHSFGCAMFIDWCRCTTSGGVGADNPLQPTCAQNNTGLWLDGSISRHRTNILLVDFPSVQLAAPPLLEPRNPSWMPLACGEQKLPYGKITTWNSVNWRRPRRACPPAAGLLASVTSSNSAWWTTSLFPPPFRRASNQHRRHQRCRPAQVY